MAMVWASKAASFLNISAFNRSFASAVLKDLKYADSHEWAKIEGNSATIGITDHAQDHLGDVVYVELPEVGTAVTQGSGFGAVESVKATSDINSPVSGKVVEVNQELSTSPGLISVIKKFLTKIEVSMIMTNGESVKDMMSKFDKPVMEQYDEMLRILGQYTQHNLMLDEAISVAVIIDKLPPSWKEFKHGLK
nr:glycine cleavage system H protein 2, mitochondrial-like [Tanacetum cinerariifolium]